MMQIVSNKYKLNWTRIIEYLKFISFQVFLNVKIYMSKNKLKFIFKLYWNLNFVRIVRVIKKIGVIYIYKEKFKAFELWLSQLELRKVGI